MLKEKLESIVSDAKTTRDEIQVQLALAKAEVKDEFSELEVKYDALRSNAQRIGAVAGDSASELSTAVELGIKAKSKEDIAVSFELASDELKKGYDKIKALL